MLASDSRASSEAQGEIQWARFLSWTPSNSHWIQTLESNQGRIRAILIKLVYVYLDSLHAHPLVVDRLGVGAGGACIWLKVGYISAGWNPESFRCKWCQHGAPEQAHKSRVKFIGRISKPKVQQYPSGPRVSHLFIYENLPKS